MAEVDVPIGSCMNCKPLIKAFWLVLCLPVLLLVPAFAEAPKVINVSADSWMPFNGEPGSKTPGYVIEIISEIFEPKGIKVSYKTMPYKEALEAARGGTVEAVIGANDVEAKGLIMPKSPIGSPCVCLLTTAKSTFDYQNLRSLHKTGVNLGVIEDYSYWPALDEHIAEAKGIVMEKGDAPLDALFKKLEAGEVTVLAECEPVLLWYLRVHKRDKSEFRAVYRHIADPIYVVFSNNDAGKEFSALFDNGIKDLRSSGKLAKILTKYGLPDWE